MDQDSVCRIERGKNRRHLVALRRLPFLNDLQGDVPRAAHQPSVLVRSSGALVWSGIDFLEGTFTALEGASVDVESSVFGHQHLEIGSINSSALGAYRLRSKFRGSYHAPCTATE